MNNPYAFWRYDLFKLIVAVILLVLLLFTFPSPPSAESSTGDAGIVTDPAPVTSSDEVTPSAPSNPTGAAGLPDFPQAMAELTLDDLNQNLLAPDGRIVYGLDEDNGGWLPVIPQEIKDGLQTGVSLVKTDEAGWAIQSDQGEVLYFWDQESLSWSELKTAPQLANSDCPAQLQPRLQTGGKARVLTNLNMRSSPGIKNNWMLTNITGTELKVLSGPVCTVQIQGAFWWWEVENPSGQIGWSAEAQESGFYYFLEPLSP